MAPGWVSADKHEREFFVKVNERLDPDSGQALAQYGEEEILDG
ncbi:hypothetical protein ACTVZO_16305 [Streptomyces sp. IBSNAI002]